MNRLLECKYGMYLATQGYVKPFVSVTSKLPGFDGYFANFNENNEIIKATKEQLEHGTSGISENGEQHRISLIKTTMEVGEKIEVYAKLNNNIVLAKEVHYSESELNKARGISLTDKAIIVYNKATEHAVEVEKYGVTAEMTVNLKAAIDKYGDIIPTIRISRSKQKMNYDNLKELFKANDTILEKMDLLVEIVKTTNPDFYKGYKNNRKVIIKGTGSLALKALVTCAHDGTEIKGAKATFTPKREMTFMAEEEVSAKPVVKRTAEKGRFRIKNIPEGIYTVTIEKVGYVPKTLTVNISDSEMAKLNVKLEKN